MYLRALEISGFKSFAKKTDLEFSTPITGIVGPNGSGKSNVAEAFRFVLGEQSIKSMRGKRGEDLIFNGSPSMARANRASVKIVLDNSKKTFPLDFDEISVERTVFRDGTNEYAINGTRTRLKDVQELLAAANIGPTGHHIISQGEADRILTANAKERREMIEDALGLKVYQYKKAESERKLQKTEENILQVESLRKEVQPHLRFLERQVKKIEKSLELKEKLSLAYREYLRREDEYLAYHHDRIVEAKKEPAAKLAALEEELRLAKETLATSEKDEKSTLLVSLEGKLRIVRDTRQETLRQDGRLEGQIAYLEKRIEEQLRKAERVEDQHVSLGRVQEAVSSVEELAGGAESADAPALRALIGRILEQLRAFIKEASHATERARDANAEVELTNLKKEKDACDAELKALEGEEERLRKEYEQLRASIEAEQSEGRKAEREVFRIVGESRTLEQKLADLERELDGLERDRADFKRELEEAVALIGRDASQYFSYEIKDDSGAVLAREGIICEERAIQLERRRELERMKIRLEELGGSSSAEIMKEYEEVRSRDEFLSREIEDLQKSVVALRALIHDLSAQLNERFLEGIEKIGVEFNTFFGLMFGGGSASLVRVQPKPRRKKEAADELLAEEDVAEEPDEDEVTEEGIEIDVKLPHKRIKGLEMLSGGERALTSIALIFAMSQVNPPLFVILDETDAALDEANSRRYGDMIESLAKKSQLILITHNRETMSRAGVLYGVTMGGDGVSKLLSVKFEEALAVAK